MTNFYVEHQYSSGEEHREWGHTMCNQPAQLEVAFVGEHQISPQMELDS